MLAFQTTWVVSFKNPNHTMFQTKVAAVVWFCDIISNDNGSVVWMIQTILGIVWKIQMILGSFVWFFPWCLFRSNDMGSVVCLKPANRSREQNRSVGLKFKWGETYSLCSSYSSRSDSCISSSCSLCSDTNCRIECSTYLRRTCSNFRVKNKGLNNWILRNGETQTY